MRVALFTNKFPAQVSTFFSCDLIALLAAGVEVEVFPLYPVDRQLWGCVPQKYQKTIRENVKIHHQDRWRPALTGASSLLPGRGLLARDIVKSALQFGTVQTIKSIYAIGYGAVSAQTERRPFDHVLAYWANYAATSAFVFRELQCPEAPYSLFLQAGTDLYRDQVYLPEKLRAAERILPACDFNRQFVADKYPELYSEIRNKFHLQPITVDVSEHPFSPGRNSPNTVIAVGRFARPKGFDVLIDAASRLIQRGMAVDLEFVGDGPELSRCKSLAEQLGIAGRIRFLGWLSPEKTKEQISKATVLVHPSTALGDAVPTVIKEAMALGTPVIASHIVGIPELLDEGKCGLLVPPTDAEALASAIKLMLSSEEMRSRFAILGRNRVEKLFDMWERGRQLAALLRPSPGVIMPCPAS